MNKNLYLVFQFEVVACDNGSPSLCAINNAQVSVFVMRNDNEPYWVNLPNTTSINENLPAGSSIFTLLARDDDTTVSNCTATIKLPYILLFGLEKSFLTLNNIFDGVLWDFQFQKCREQFNYDYSIIKWYTYPATVDIVCCKVQFQSFISKFKDRVDILWMMIIIFYSTGSIQRYNILRLQHSVEPDVYYWPK